MIREGFIQRQARLRASVVEHVRWRNLFASGWIHIWQAHWYGMGGYRRQLKSELKILPRALARNGRSHEPDDAIPF